MVAWFCFLLFQQIDLTTVDLGRFLENGEQIFGGNWQDVLHTNFYSSDYSQYPFLNHHWGTGVIFYFIYKIGSFFFLHLFAICMSILTFLILFNIAKKEVGVVVSILLSLMMIPLMAYRKEIRPEIFSCFFSATFFYILWFHRNKEISVKYLWVLPFLEILWVNLHLYFFLGPAIVGAFLLERIILFIKDKKQVFRSVAVVFSSVVLATFINPFGWKGVFYPFQIYNERGYLVLEEQSVWFLSKLNIHNPSFLFFEIILVFVILSFLGVLIKKRRELPLVNLFLAGGFAFMACWSIRNITLFAFMSLPILAKNIKIIWPELNFNSLNKKVYYVILSVILVLTVCVVYNKYLPMNSGAFGLGLVNDQSRAIEFFKKNKLQGPIFNNYDIGGYLIYYLFPEEKVFVDNRPETYPSEFFQNVYIPMQEDEGVWEQKSEEYNINTIIFYWHDATPWGQQFLITRVGDNDWAPVFIDEKIIIFLKRNELNKEVINKFEISRDIFLIK